MDLGLHGKVAIVTGASRGIGRQIAIDLAREGCDVVLGGRDIPALEDVATEVENAGAGAVAVPVDLTAAGSAEALVDAALRFRSRIDILVNNAGANVARKLEALTEDDWRTTFELNFFAAVRITQATLPTMRSQKRGRVISVASIYGRQPDPLFGPYSAAKAALINFSANVSRAYASEGVLSNCVLPGVTITEMIEKNTAAAAKAMGSTPAEVMTKMMAKEPVSIGRFGEPAEVSAAVVFLASEQARWITGSCLTVDGGTIRVVP